ncbi:MAG: hypothetical protein EAZ08_12545 [Cytophagales bacterium]|nr:MAG: hypothetical protein EAZ08_12545 [Cytophagales bacterium]
MKSNLYKFLILAFFSFSCKESEVISLEGRFSKIYNEDSFSDFVGADIQQTNDDGYLLLGAIDNSFSNQKGLPYVLKVDKAGNFLWDTKKNTFLQKFYNLIPYLKKINGEYFFFCRDNTSKAINLLKINDDTQAITSVRAYNDLNGDLVYSSQTPDGGLLLMMLSETCDARKQPEQIKLDKNFAVQWRKCYPFFITVPIDAIDQKLNLNYFFNGTIDIEGQQRYFITFLNQNNTSSILFTDENGTLLGETHTSFLINSLDQISGKDFAMTYIKQKDTNLVIKTALKVTEKEFLDISGNTFHEINSEKRVITKKMTINAKEVVVFACTLENIPIRLYAFEPKSGSLKGTITLGRINPYEIANLIQTRDGGMAIIANTLVADRFIRIALLKLSPEEVLNFIN